MLQRTRKAQVLFTPEEYAVIEEEAKRQGKAVGVIIREAAQRYIIYYCR